MLESIINILFIAFGVASASIPLICEVKKDAPTKAKPDRTSFTTMGKVFIGIAALTIIFGGIKYVLDTDHQKKMQDDSTTLLIGNSKLLLAHKTDSLEQIIRDEKCKKDAEINGLRNQEAFNHLRDSLNNSMHKTETNINKNIENTAQKTNAKIDSSKNKTENPLLDIYDIVEPGNKYVTNPLFTWDSVSKNWKIEVIITNSEDSKAINFDIHFVYIFAIGENGLFNERYRYEIGIARFTKSKIISKEFPYDLTLTVKDDEYDNTDSLRYLAIQVTYQNTKGISQMPLQKIFIINKGYINKDLPQIVNSVYDNFEAHLINLKFWQKKQN